MLLRTRIVGGRVLIASARDLISTVQWQVSSWRTRAFL